MKTHFTLCVLVVTILLPFPSSARTWNVRQDGTGDYSVIQDAVDVAEEGDTINIGPGLYTEFGTYNMGYGWFDGLVYVNTDQLTFIGAGADQTFIGSADFNDHDIETIGMLHSEDFTWSISGIKFVNINFMSIYNNDGHLDIFDCEFENCERGIRGYFSEGVHIRQCLFQDIARDAIAITSPAPGAMVTNNRFFNCNGGVRFDGEGCSDVLVSHNTFVGGTNGVGLYRHPSGEIRNNTISDFSGSGMLLVTDGHLELTDNSIRSDSGQTCLFVDSIGYLTAEQNIFEGCDETLFFLSAPLVDYHFHGNHILRGDGQYFRSPEDFPWNHSLDLSHNYWGTTDLEEIAAHIIDGRVLPNSNFIVYFEPVEGGPVSTDLTTLGSLKAMFR